MRYLLFSRRGCVLITIITIPGPRQKAGAGLPDSAAAG
jgi:hypothetical protein